MVRFVCEGSRGEDYCGGERRADRECLVDGLLGRVSYGGRLMISVREPNVLDFLIILYSELFVCQMGFKHFFRFFLKKVAFELKKEKRKTGFSLDKGG
jgi:hypothetical protein